MTRPRLCFPPCLPVAALLLAAPVLATGPTNAASPTMGATRDGSHDFDFLAGRWYAHSRRLARPLDPADDQWEEFDSVHDGVLLPSGFGVADDYRIPSRPEFVGLALQLHDPKTGLWQAYWYRLGVLTASLVGRFDDGVGVFEGADTHDGKPIRTRYTWSHVTATTARWEQAFSADEGRSWESNWVMTYSRVPPQE